MIQSLIIILSIIVLWTLTYIQDWTSVFLFMFILTLSNYIFKLPDPICFGLSGIFACLMHIKFANIETFKTENDENENEEYTDDENDIDDNEVDEDEIDEIDEDDAEDATEEDESDFKNSDKSNPIDMTATIKNALNNFDPTTLEKMTNDTTNLIKSQSELMNVIEQMQPVISKGMALVDKFQGNGKTEELFKKFHILSKKR